MNKLELKLRAELDFAKTLTTTSMGAVLAVLVATFTTSNPMVQKLFAILGILFGIATLISLAYYTKTQYKLVAAI